MALTDESIMPFGQYKGQKLEDVPAAYLIWLLDNNKCGKDLRQYIMDNMDVLRKEVRESKK